MIIEVCCFPFLRYYNSYPSQVDNELLDWLTADSDNDEMSLRITGFMDSSDPPDHCSYEGPLPPQLNYINASLADLR